jgi:hypothetical protein
MKKNFQSMSNISLNVNRSNGNCANSDEIILKADEKISITGTSTISKKSGKKFSYFTSKLSTQNQSATTTTAKTPPQTHHNRTYDNDDTDDNDGDNKSLHNNSASNKCNMNAIDHTVVGNNIYNSISTTSISDMRNLYQKKQSQLNQKFQTLRRSFNTKTSLTKMQVNGDTTPANSNVTLTTTTATTPTSGMNKLLSAASSNNTLTTTSVLNPKSNISPTSSMTKSLKKSGTNKKVSSKNDDVLFDLLNSDHFKKQQQQYSLNIKDLNGVNSNGSVNCSNGRKEFLSPESPTFLHSYISSGNYKPFAIIHS